MNGRLRHRQRRLTWARLSPAARASRSIIGWVAWGEWQAASPATVGKFTAVGYFFARDLFQKLGVPIGIVHSSWGGTPVESWLSPAALASNPAFQVVGERWRETLASYPANQAAYVAALDASDDQLDFPTLFAVGRDGCCTGSPSRPIPRLSGRWRRPAEGIRLEGAPS